VGEAKASVISLFKKYWSIFIAVFLIITIIYFPKISNYNYSVDTERMIRFPDYTLHWWLRLGRYGLVALTKIPIFGGGTHVGYINFLTYFLLFVSTIVLTFLFDNTGKRTKIEQLLAISLYVSTPVILEQTNFILQSAPVVFSTIIMLIGYGSLKKYIKTKKTFYLILGIFLEIFSFSVYVSLVMGFIALTIVNLCYSSRVDSWGLKKYFIRVCYMASTCIISYLGYLIVNKLIFKIVGLESTSYLSDSRLWGKLPAEQVISTIKNTIITNFSFTSPFVFWGTVTLLVIYSMLSIINKENFTITLITVVGLVVIGTYTIPLFGYFGTIRSYFPVYPIILYGLSLIIFQSCKLKSFKYFIYLLALIIVGCQSYNSFLFGLNEANVYRQEVAFVNLIKEELVKRNITDYENYKLAIVGGKRFEEIIHGDMLGNTVFSWDLGSDVGSSYRAGDFIYNHGMKFQRITPADYQKLRNLFVEMEAFPNPNSIRIEENILILKLD
jgi:hypothetical protein